MTPAKLYKYRPFSIRSLRMITEAEFFYAPPASFNDPMDCDPTIEVDIGRSTLERLLYRLLLRTRADARAREAIESLRYHSMQYGDYEKDPKVEAYLRTMLADDIRRALRSELGQAGVLSLSATWASPLMWSHYADEHRGYCIEFDTMGMAHPRLAPVSYRAPRAIRASDVAKWKFRDDAEAEERVSQTYYYAKSSEWRYEKEWRDLRDKSGAGEADYRITAIHFGLRCDEAVIVSMVKLLTDNKNIKLYQIAPREDSFRLRRTLVARGAYQAMRIREPGFMMFPDVIASDEGDEAVVEGGLDAGA